MGLYLLIGIDQHSFFFFFFLNETLNLKRQSASRNYRCLSRQALEPGGARDLEDAICLRSPAVPPSYLSSNVDPKCRLCPLIPVDGKRRPQTLAGSLSRESKYSFPWASFAASSEQDDNGGSGHGVSYFPVAATTKCHKMA